MLQPFEQKARAGGFRRNDERHEIYAGATPAWSSVWAAATGLPAGAEIRLSASFIAGTPPRGRPFVSAPRALLDQVRPPSEES